METATEQLKQIVIEEIRRGPHPYAENYGSDWCNISKEEAHVFGLSLEDLPQLINVWCAFEVVMDICDQIDVPPSVIEGFLIEHPWLTEHRAARPRILDEKDFIKFSAMFDVEGKLASAWYQKWNFWSLRHS